MVKSNPSFVKLWEMLDTNVDNCNNDTELLDNINVELLKMRTSGIIIIDRFAKIIKEKEDKKLLTLKIKLTNTKTSLDVVVVI